MIINDLEKKGLIHIPNWMNTNCQYIVLMGSHSYGMAHEESDLDIYGFCIPPKYLVFSHLAGIIEGWDKQVQKFEQYSEAHIIYDDGNKRRKYDLSIYSIVKFFRLVADNNPNMVDSLFVPQSCVLHSTAIGNLVRENRKMFLHKGCWAKLKGYSFSQISKMNSKNATGKRLELIEKYSFDVKYASHVVRLLGEAEQILSCGDLDLQLNNEHLKAIRRGEWTKEQVIEYFNSKEKYLESLYEKSTLPWGPPEDKIKALLIECLHMHYGSLEGVVVEQDKVTNALRDIRNIINKIDL